MDLRRLILIGLMVPLFSSCWDLVEWSCWEYGEYYTSDCCGSPGCQNLYLRVSRNGIARVNCVVSIGADEKYIVAKSRKGFWIIDTEKDNTFFNADEIVEGPFNESEYILRGEELGISEIDWKGC